MNYPFGFMASCPSFGEPMCPSIFTSKECEDLFFLLVVVECSYMAQEFVLFVFRAGFLVWVNLLGLFSCSCCVV